MVGWSGWKPSWDNPESAAICDGCGLTVPHNVLRENTEWRGRAIMGTGFYVCEACNDVPNEQLRTPNLRPDPTPIANPRPDTADYQVAILADASGFPGILSDPSGFPIDEDP